MRVHQKQMKWVNTCQDWRQRLIVFRKQKIHQGRSESVKQATELAVYQRCSESCLQSHRNPSRYEQTQLLWDPLSNYEMSDRNNLHGCTIYIYIYTLIFRVYPFSASNPKGNKFSPWNQELPLIKKMPLFIPDICEFNLKKARCCSNWFGSVSIYYVSEPLWSTMQFGSACIKQTKCTS